VADNENTIRVRLDPELRVRLDRFAVSTHRNMTQSVNLLLGSALAMVETQTNVDALFTQAPQHHLETHGE
jgi:predicted transcriptional regulator